MNGTPLWTSAEAAEVTGGSATGVWVAGGVSIDSRTVDPGDLFVAIRGPENDGHDYVRAALSAGAAAAVVHRRPDGVGTDAPLLLVDDTLDALTALGRRGRDRSTARVAAVTGSAGKTGTKEALRHALAGQGAVSASAASYNNLWGVPLSLSRMPPGSAFGAFEVGMNHAGEIAPLSRLIRPHVAVITNVEAAHIAFFPSMEAVADAKAEIFEGVEPGGACVLNRDNMFFDRLRASAARRPDLRVVSFGLSDADATAREVSLDEEGSDVAVEICGRRIAYRVALPGRHWVLNSLAVLAAVEALGADADEAAARLRSLAPLPGRGKPHSVSCAGGTFTLIDESYNANPASMRAAIETLGRVPPRGAGRRIAILGPMRELGRESAAFHEGLAAPLVESGVDTVMAAGDMRAVLDRLPAGMRGATAETGEALARTAAQTVGPGDVVMVKGSNASRMDLVVARLLDAADSRQAVAAGN